MFVYSYVCIFVETTHTNNIPCKFSKVFSDNFPFPYSFHSPALPSAVPLTHSIPLFTSPL